MPFSNSVGKKKYNIKFKTKTLTCFGNKIKTNEGV